MIEKIENGKYDYKPFVADKLEVAGCHTTIGTITKDEALQMAKALIDAAQNPNEEGNVTVDFSLDYPHYKGDAPEITLSFTGAGYWKPKLHWATIEGNEIFTLSDEWLDKEMSVKN